ncbi:MAG: response regulator transcription factor, partial [Lachnospiraceae bacterium]|nr:response regulator transcription factor [Lachnospiraceae bacterium]
DDYITKPFNPLEVVARVNSQLRRYTRFGAGKGPQEIYRAGGIELNDAGKSVTVDGESVFLTPKEYDILHLLIASPNKVFSPKEIYRKVWKEEPFAGNDNTVAVHIRHLREKIEINPKEPRYIKVIFGQGYMLEKSQNR